MFAERSLLLLTSDFAKGVLYPETQGSALKLHFWLNM